MNSLLEQIKKRRKALGLKQKDMTLRVGMSPQQYQRLESKGNPRLDTLELITKGLKGELMFIPQDQVAAVRSLLLKETDIDSGFKNDKEKSTVTDNPWKDILKDDE